VVQPCAEDTGVQHSHAERIGASSSASPHHRHRRGLAVPSERFREGR